MKRVLMGALLIAATLFCTTPARAWNCSNPLASRVDVGPTKPAGAVAGDGDGQYYIGKDAANPNDYYVCQVPKPPTTPPSTSTNSSNSSSSSSSNSTSGSTSSATGGNASATGGSSSSKSGVNNSGNSSNTNTNTANGGQGGSANASANGGAGGAGGNASSSNNSTGSGNTTSVNSTYNEVRQTATAMAPDVAVTAPCTKGMSAAAQSGFFGASIGGSKVDRGCDARETARYFATLLHNRTAAAKIMCDTPAAQHAHLTLEDCLASIPEPQPVVQAAPVPQAQVVPNTTIVVPAPNLSITLPVAVAQVEQPAPVAKVVVKHTYTPYVGPYSGQYLFLEGPLSLVCEHVELLVKLGVPRNHIRVSGSEKYHSVHVFVVD
jgi:hypothetical protein